MAIIESRDAELGEHVPIKSSARDGLRDSATLLGREWWVIVTAALLGGLVALFYSLLATPVYSSAATLYVTSGSDANAQSAYQGSLASQQRVVSYAQLATSEAVVSKALSDSGLSLALDDARVAISASSRPETVLLTVAAKDADPGVAATLANAVASSLTSYIASLEEPSGGGDALAKLTIVSRAVPSTVPVEPNVVRNTVLGFVIGLVGGLILVLIRSRLDNRIHSAEDLSGLSEYPVLAEVPVDPDVADLSVSNAAAGASPSSEAYRRLRTNLSFINVDKPARKIVVTSAGESEGKTTTSVNLAVVLAEAGKRVVVVDADLRRPRVASAFGLNPGVGLTDCLRDAVGVDDVIQQTAFDNVDLLASGSLPPNPSELLGSRKAAILFDALASQYDCVIIDTPPVMPLTDAAVTSQWSDGVVLVVRAGRTKKPDYATTVESLSHSVTDVIGVVLNGSKNANERYGYYYGRGAEGLS